MIRVLYVDDEAALLDVCKIFLELSDEIKVDTTSSVDEALRLIDCGHYDAVISDYQMPVANGIDLLKRIREKEQTPFILFTGRGREEVVIEALNCGVDFYLQKGGDPRAQFKELEHKVREAVRRNRAENALKLNEERLTRAQRIGHTGSWEFIWDATSDHYWGSEESFRIFGIERPPEGRASQDFIEKRVVEREMMSMALQDLIHGVHEYDLEYHVWPADGSPMRTVRSTAELIRDSEGRPVKVIGVLQDITERKKAEASLLKSEEEHAKLIAAIPDLVIRTEIDGTITMVNETTLAVSGYARNEVLGRNLLSFMAPEDLPRVMENLRRMMDGQLGPVEYRLVMKDGRVLPFEAHGDVLREKGGMPSELVFVVRDMTERRRLESNLREANRRFRVMDNITRHDTLNKLASLQGYIELMRAADSAKRPDRLDRMDGIVKALMEQMDISREYQDIGTCSPVWQSIGQVCGKAASAVHLDGIELRLETGTAEILADKMLDRVFYNLMDNSMKHGGHVGHIAVTYSADADGLKIIYQDDGIGISAKDRDHLFEKGYGRWHGLGLFLSREILDITNISIRENGGPGEGARFEMLVPLDHCRNIRAGTEGTVTARTCANGIGGAGPER